MSLLSSPSSSTTTFRLLYRGALSLPDSHLLLDGLSFFATAGGSDLLDNPLPLALESMRGRPSLRFMGQVKLADVYIDDSADVALDIHPQAMVSQIYFENTFCLLPLGSSRSDIGVKVALGDTDGPETTNILIYARSLPESPSTIRLCVGRITNPPPVQPIRRAPRPDDPTPRLPPLHFAMGKPARVRELKRSASTADVSSKSSSAKKAKSTLERSLTISAVPDRAKNKGNGAERPFKVPEVPLQDKGKGKAILAGDDGISGPKIMADPKLETNNKRLIKDCAIQHLNAGILPPGLTTSDTSACYPFRGCPPIPNTHPEHKELLGYVYRGVSFALRAVIKQKRLDPQHVDQLVRTHVQMYVPSADAP